MMNRFSASVRIGTALLVLLFSGLSVSRGQQENQAAVIKGLISLQSEREKLLKNDFSISYTVESKKLPGHNAFMRKQVEDKTLTPFEGMYSFKDNEVQMKKIIKLDSQDKRLRFSHAFPYFGALIEEIYCSDGKTSWLRRPQERGVEITKKTNTLESLGESFPLYHEFLCKLPLHSPNLGVIPRDAVSLSQFLSSNAEAAILSESEGRIQLTINLPQKRTGHSTIVKLVFAAAPHNTLLRYEVCQKHGEFFFPPDFEVSFSEFEEEATSKLPRKIVMLKTMALPKEKQRLPAIEPQYFDFYPMEEVTFALTQVELQKTFPENYFALKIASGTNVYDQFSGREHISK